MINLLQVVGIPEGNDTEQHPEVVPISEYAVSDVVPAAENKKKNKKVSP